MSQALQGATFHIEHIVPISKGGENVEDNLALACPSCNLHKSSSTESVDPESGQIVPLFHPRQDEWAEHFRLEGLRIAGMTAVGRATVEKPQFNSERRLRIRRIERILESEP